MKKKLFIISSEKIYHSDEKDFFCDNIDIKNLSEKLSSYFDVCLAGRNSKKKRYHHINLKNMHFGRVNFAFIDGSHYGHDIDYEFNYISN